jgi:hypothetical protein
VFYINNFILKEFFGPKSSFNKALTTTSSIVFEEYVSLSYTTSSEEILPFKIQLKEFNQIKK